MVKGMHNVKKAFNEICKEKNISPSYTRRRIYEYIDESKNHPTVDEIYKELIGELPTLSKTTVYNVLSLFIENDLVDPINTSNNEKRYEVKIEEHSHFICNLCHTIYDLPKVETSYNKLTPPGFDITREEVNLYGVCPSCKAKNIL